MTLVCLDIKAAVKFCWSFSSPLWKTNNYLCAIWTKLVCTTLIRSAEHWRLTRNVCCLYAVLLNLSGSETITMLSQKLFLNLIQLRAGLMSAHPSLCAWAQYGPAGNCALGKHTWGASFCVSARGHLFRWPSALLQCGQTADFGCS